MKLIYFIPLLSTVGGQERTITDKANYLVNHGHSVMIVTYEHEGKLAYSLNSAVRHVDLDCHFFNLYRYPFYLRFIEVLKLKINFKRKMKNLISKFQPNVVVIAIPNTENFICDVMSVVGDVPVVVESHLACGCQVIKRGATETWIYRFQNPFKAVLKANLLITLTEGDAKRWRFHHAREVGTVPNPLTEYYETLSVCPKVNGRIICVGRLTPQKRFDRLIDAFSLIADKYSDWYIDIYGDGEDKEKLQKQVIIKGLSGRVNFLQPVKDIYFQFQRSEFLVMSSDFEGFGLVIIEAMACGIPVVATDCPFGPSEIIEDGVTGLLTKMEVHDLADKIEWMITHNDERKEMGFNAHKSASKYKKEQVMQKWETAYLSVIK